MRSLLFLVLLFATPGCLQKNSGSQAASNQDTVQFFQLAEYINEQIAEVENTPYFIYEKKTEQGNTDSFPITSKQFALMARPFAAADINSPPLKENYIENPFFDQTTKTYTLNYTAKDKTLEVQNIDVLLHEDAQTLKRIFIRKFYDYKDSTAMEQLSWKPNQQFEITRMVQQPGGTETIRQITVVWNDKRN
jgi:hypothetical protein